MRGPFVSSRSGDSATARPKFHLLQGFGRRPPPLLGDNLGANTSSHRHASLATMRMYLLLVIAADALRLPAAPYISQDCNAGRRAPRAPERPPPSRRDWNDFIRLVQNAHGQIAEPARTGVPHCSRGLMDKASPS